MRLQTAFTVIVLTSLATAVPVAEDDNDKLVITSDIYPEQYVIYTSEHEIVNLVVPLNNLNFADNADNNYVFFFVEADKDDFGNRIDKGLYLFKDDSARKLLDNGRDVAAAVDESKNAFIAAQDGIYLYNGESDTVEKYTSISDSIIGIAKPSESDIVYILTEDKEVFAVSENGEKERINEIVDAEQIIIDYSDNLYYLDANKQVYVYDSISVKKIEGIPEHAVSAQLLKPSVMSDGIVPLVVDEKLYLIKRDGKAEVFDKIEFAPDGKPTAYAMETGLMHYYAKNKMIYEFDILDIYLNGFKGFLSRIVNEYVALGYELIVLLGLINFV